MSQKHTSFERVTAITATALSIAAGVGATAARAAVSPPAKIAAIGRQIERNEHTPDANATLHATLPEQDATAEIDSASKGIEGLDKVEIAVDNKHHRSLLSLAFSKKPNGEWGVVKRVDGVKQKPDQTNLEQSETQAKTVLNYVFAGKNVPNSVLYERVASSPSSKSTAPQPKVISVGNPTKPNNVQPLDATGAPGTNTTVTSPTAPETPTSPIGTTGTTGSTGPEAPTGPTGSTGTTGDTGPTGPEAPTVPIKISADPEVYSGYVTSTTANTLVRYTAYNSALGCSGRVLYNPQHLAVGEVTCDHDGLLTDQDNIATDSEGQQYYNLPNPLRVDIGSEAGDSDAEPGESTEVGIGDKAMIVPDGTSDEVVVAFVGQDINYVDQLAQEASVDPTTLEPGTVVVESGKPATTDGSTAQTQKIPMTIVGSVSNWTVSENGNTLENLPVTLAITPGTADGKGCTPGISGAGAFLLTGPNSSNTREIATNAAGEPIMVGTANSYDVLSSTVTTGTTLSWLINEFPNVDLSDFQTYINNGGTAYLCAIASLPKADQTETIPFGNPEYPSISNLADQFRDNLVDPGDDENIFNGILNFGSTWLYRPAYYVDTATNTLLLGVRQSSSTPNDTQVSDYIDVMVFSNASQYISSMSGFSLDGVTAPAVTTVEGALSLSPDYSELEDSTGAVVGEDLQNVTANNTGASFSMDSNGNIIVNQPAGGAIPTVTIASTSSSTS